jgi:hypothetical protein
MRSTIGALLAAALLLAGCDRERGMGVRTYELHRLQSDEAITLLTPYIREGGFISGKGRLVTVREKPDRLDSIAAVLRRYDGAPVAVSLHFQVIEAGDFEGGDSAIARVEAPLRELFRYRGYRLVKDATLQAVEGVPFNQADDAVKISGQLRAVTPDGPDAGVTIDVSVTTPGGTVSTAVSGAPGQTLLIGSQKQGGNGALILAVQPTIARGAGR